MNESRDYRRFFAELKRRKVFQVAAVYGATGFLVLQIADLLQEGLQLSQAFLTGITVLIMLGFPIALVLAWAYETSPEGVRRTDDAQPGEITQIIAQPAAKRWPSGVLALVGTGLLLLGGWLMMGRGDAAGDSGAPAPEGSGEAGRAAGNGDAGAARATVAGLSPVEAGPRSIAVLPFENMAGDPDAESFVSGVHDDILTQLSKIEALHVTSRTSVREYAETEKSIREIAAELGVANILEGGVQRAGNRVRINVQLIDAETDRHLWAETYDRELTAETVFEIQGEIARQVASALRAELTAEEEGILGQVQTRSLAALDAYNRGRVLIDNPSDANDRAAVAHFARAVELDPDFRPARVELVRAQSWLLREGLESDTTPARNSLDQLVELAPDAPETRVAAGYYRYYALGDYEGALGALREAERLEPDDVQLLTGIGWVLRRLGRYEESIDYTRRTLESSPRDVSQLWNLAITYQRLRRFDEARQLYMRAMALQPTADVIFGFGFNHLLWGEGDIEAARDFASAHGPMMDDAARLMAAVDLARASRDFATTIDRLSAAGAYAEHRSFRLPVAIGGPQGTLYRPLLLAKLYRHAGDTAMSRLYADSAIAEASTALELRPAPAPHDLFGRRAVVHAVLGLGFALRGDSAAAVREGARAVELFPPDYDGTDGAETVAALAEVLVLVGAHDRAITELQRLSEIPSFLAPATLRLDPLYDPLRGNPRFEALLEKEWTLPIANEYPR